jgi:hypothetical protein
MIITESVQIPAWQIVAGDMIIMSGGDRRVIANIPTLGGGQVIYLDNGRVTYRDSERVAIRRPVHPSRRADR